MATSVATVFHSAADGEQFSAGAWRLGATSHANVINDGSDALKSRSGILPGAGTPLDVTQLVSPGMQVTVKKGTVVQQSTSALGGVYSHSLTSDTNLDIATAHASNPRLDVVVATVFDDGTSGSNTKIEVLTGSAAASPSLPAALTSPPAYTHYFPLAQVRVEAAVASIVTAKITKPVVSALALTMGQFTCAPGGVIRGITRQWVGTRTVEDAIAPGATGTSCQVTVPAADAVPGIYAVEASGGFTWKDSSGISAANVKLVTPGRTRSAYYNGVTGTYFWSNLSDMYVLQTGPGTSLTFTLSYVNSFGTNNLYAGFPDPPASNASIIVTRIADF